MTFCKLDSGITKSSLWSEPYHVRIVFVSFLAEKDDLGFVSASRSGMIRTCNVTPEDFDEAEKILSSPDIESKNTDNDGRRIEKVEGGWIVLNHESYRLPEDEKKEKRKEYMREFMAEKRKIANTKLTAANSVLTSVSVSVSDSVSLSEKKEEVQEKEEKLFDGFRKQYPGTKRGLETEFLNFCKKHKDWKKVVLILSESLENQILWRNEMLSANMFVPEWKMLQTWINQRCWEMEKPKIEIKVTQNKNNQFEFQRKAEGKYDNLPKTQY